MLFPLGAEFAQFKLNTESGVLNIFLPDSTKLGCYVHPL